MPIIQSAFNASPILRNAHIQTLWAPLFRQQTTPDRHTEPFELPDGDFLQLDWVGASTDPRQPLAVLLHGLTGSADSKYIVGVQNCLQDKGISSVVMNFRGCGDELNRKARMYHSGETQDLEVFYQHLRRELPQTPLIFIGFSLGGNVLLKWLGETGQDAGIELALAVSAPLELQHCVNRMDNGFSRVYRNRLINQLRHSIEQKKRIFLHQNNQEELMKLESLGDLSTIRSFWDFDDRIVAPLHGFESAADYYAKCSSRQFLSSIMAPTHILHSLDDPFMLPDIIPEEKELSSQVTLEVSYTGGHVGFIEKPGRYYIEDRLCQLLGL